MIRQLTTSCSSVFFYKLLAIPALGEAVLRGSMDPLYSFVSLEVEGMSTEPEQPHPQQAAYLQMYLSRL